MPVYVLRCPDCDNRFKGMVLAGTRPPRIWECSQCGGGRAAPDPNVRPIAHPWDGDGHGSGCLCCGPAPAADKTSGRPKRE